MKTFRQIQKVLKEERKFKFMIHFKGAAHSNELYDAQGREIYDLEAAIAAAEEKYPGEEYEIYNGQESHSTFKEDVHESYKIFEAEEGEVGEYDVHFTLKFSDLFGKLKARSKEEAKDKALKMLRDKVHNIKVSVGEVSEA